MYLSQFALARYLVYCLLLQIVAFIAILSSADEVRETFTDEDKNQAFSVGEGQQQLNIKAASNSSKIQEGYIAYCPCMGKLYQISVFLFCLIKKFTISTCCKQKFWSSNERI